MFSIFVSENLRKIAKMFLTMHNLVIVVVIISVTIFVTVNDDNLEIIN